jgi:opacity protein-like surface antigen
MKKFLSVLFTLAFVNASFAADADSYLEIGYTGLTYKEDSYSFSPSNIRLVVGKNEGNIGYEGLFGLNASNSSKTISGVAVSYKTNYILGLYGKALVMPSKEMELFGRLGWAKVDQTVTGRGTSVSDSGSGLSYGFGAKYQIAKNINLNADYMVYYPTKNDISLTGYTFGLGFDF